MTNDFFRGAAALSLILGLLAAGYYYLGDNNSEIESFSETQNISTASEENEIIKLTEEISSLENTIASLEEADDSNPGNTQTQESVKIAILEIEPGMNLQDISERLLQLQIIDNRNNFHEVVRSSGSEQNIQIGTYEINDAMSLEEIAELITAG